MGILLGARIGFKEEDSPNFQRSCYSKTQATMSTSVVLRVVMQSIFTCMVSVWVVGVGRDPWSVITWYDKVADIPNFVTTVDELLSMSIEKANHRPAGMWNFRVPGVVSHIESLRMNKE
uniref:Uncharacterized protein n=1 Tax=Physcomitrium patens TaxID=3218 RepID=A0A2K1KJI0_PHYPA|nr:hypothetical protein PHYPA_007612 [Physcomitrium patens]